MRAFFTTAFLLALGAVSPQDKKEDSLVFDFRPRYYNVSPCYCPTDGERINTQEYERNNPNGEYKDQKPIVLKPSDSLLVH